MTLGKFFFWFFFCTAFIAGGTSSVVAQTTPATDAQKPIVVVITIDGLPARALADPRLPMPTLRSLAAKGAVATAMQPINPHGDLAEPHRNNHRRQRRSALRHGKRIDCFAR